MSACRAPSRRIFEIQDAYLQEETARKGITDMADLTPVQGNLYLWQGDITTLRCGAIVNAANSQMLGCFWPCHGCIDNAIHTYAGVQLRAACAALMKKQGQEEETGKQRSRQRSICPATTSCIPWARLFPVPCRKRTRHCWPPVTVPVWNLLTRMESGASLFAASPRGNFTFPMMWRQKLP